MNPNINAKYDLSDKKLKPDEVKEYRSAAIEAGTLGSSASFFAEREFA